MSTLQDKVKESIIKDLKNGTPAEDILGEFLEMSHIVSSELVYIIKHGLDEEELNE